MKYLLLLLLFTLLLSTFLTAQNCQQNLIDGDNFTDHGDYRAALKAYIKAQDCDSTLTSIIHNKIEVLTNQFFFYEDSVARIFEYKSKKHIYINKQGALLVEDRFGRAEEFKSPGFAKAEVNKTEYLIDTKGNKYKVASSLKDIPNDIIALDLRNHGLETLPDSLKKYDIEVLLLGNNKFKNLPNIIYKFKNLKTLQLYRNQLDTLSPEIEQLKSLVKLYLEGNYLKNIPAEIGQLTNLRELNLGSNSLNSLPAEVGDLKELTALYLNHNSLSNLPAEIEQLTNLTRLNLSNNALSDLPAEI